MKSLACNISALTFLIASGHGSADVIYSGLQDTPIALTYDGINIDVDFDATWDLNPYLGGAYLANNTAFQPARDGTGGMDTVNRYDAGVLIDGGLLYATGMGGSIDHLGATFTAGQEGYLGFKLGSNYGWMRVVFTNNTDSPVVPVIKDWAYNTGGGTIATGNVLQSGATFTLNSDLGSFTLGSQVTGSNSVVKEGANSVTLIGNNSYTGTTTVSAGTLLINGNASTATGNVNVNAGTLGGTGIIGGAVTVAGAATLSPGPSIDSLAAASLTMESGAIFAYGVADNSSTGADLLGINGTLSLDNVTLSFDLATAGALGGGGWSMNDKLTLMSYGGAAITSGFAGYTNNAEYIFGSNKWLFKYNDTVPGDNFIGDLTGSNYVTMTVIPEPRAALLGGLGMLALLRRRRSA